eukprot:snap_masked-scaffold_1-processed-gene-19.63-mRNA-1 protein AED:1.00 eAED:1.00 QI:0/-1/0/0/-1/1/1/0/177
MAQQVKDTRKLNPWARVDDVFENRLVSFYYKRCMVFGLLVMVLSLFGFLLGDVCGYINFAGFLHIIPILFPCTGRGLSPVYWLFISLLSIIFLALSLLVGLFSDCFIETGILVALVAVCELGNIFYLNKLDPDLITKVKACWSESGCFLQEDRYNRNQQPSNQNGVIASDGVNGQNP